MYYLQLLSRTVDPSIDAAEKGVSNGKEGGGGLDTSTGDDGMDMQVATEADGDGEGSGARAIHALEPLGSSQFGQVQNRVTIGTGNDRPLRSAFEIIQVCDAMWRGVV